MDKALRALLVLAALPLFLAPGSQPWEGSLGPPFKIAGSQIPTYCYGVGGSANTTGSSAAAHQAIGYWCDYVDLGDLINSGGTIVNNFTASVLSNHDHPLGVQYHLNPSASKRRGTGRCTSDYSKPCDIATGGEGEGIDQPANIPGCGSCDFDFWPRWLNRRRHLFARDANGWRMTTYGTHAQFPTVASGVCPAVSGNCYCNIEAASGVCAPNSKMCSTSGEACAGVEDCTAELDRDGSAQECEDVSDDGCSTDLDCGNVLGTHGQENSTPGHCIAANVTWKFCAGSPAVRCHNNTDCQAMGYATCGGGGDEITVPGLGLEMSGIGCEWLANTAEFGEDYFRYFFADLPAPDWSGGYDGGNNFVGVTRVDGPYGPASDPDRFKGEFGGHAGLGLLHTDDTMIQMPNTAVPYGITSTRICSGTRAGCRVNANCPVGQYCAGDATVHGIFADGIAVSPFDAAQTLTGAVARRLQAEYFHHATTGAHSGTNPTSLNGSSGGLLAQAARDNYLLFANESKWCSGSASQCSQDSNCGAFGPCLTFQPTDGYMQENGGFMGYSFPCPIEGQGSGIWEVPGGGGPANCSSDGYALAVDFWNDVAKASPTREKVIQVLPYIEQNISLYSDSYHRFMAASLMLVYQPQNYTVWQEWGGPLDGAIKCYFCSTPGVPLESCTGFQSGYMLPSGSFESCYMDAYKGILKFGLGCPAADYQQDTTNGKMTREFERGFVAVRYKDPVGSSGQFTAPVHGASNWCYWKRTTGVSQASDWVEDCTTASGGSFTLAEAEARIMWEENVGTPGGLWTCELEQGQVCGDGTKEGTEDCDDGTRVSSQDSCLGTCAAAVCGDGWVCDETCPDGTCTLNVANNYYSCDAGSRIGKGCCLVPEQCDDGNTAAVHDGCEANCTRTVDVGANLVTNASFASDMTGWAFFTDGSASIVTTDARAAITITTSGSNVQLYQAPLSIVQDQCYRLQFDARIANEVGVSNDVRMIFFKNVSPFTTAIPDTLYDLTATARTHTAYLTGAATIADTRLRAALEDYDFPGEIYTFDNIELRTVIPECGNGILEGAGLEVPCGTETCDDGNTNNGDGCSSMCVVEVATPKKSVESAATAGGARIPQ